MDFRDSSVLVTGGAGFIGSEVVRQLLEKGAIVTVLDNFSSGKKEYLPSNKKKLRIIKGDILNERTVAIAVKDQEIVIHIAALPFIPDSYYYPADFFKVNAIGEIINVGSGTEITIQDLAFKIAKVAEKKIKIRYDKSRERPYDVNRLICNNKKARELLGWKPKISIDKGLKITFDWAKKNRVTFSAPFKRWYFKNENSKAK